MKKFLNEVKACLSRSHIYTKPENNKVGKALAYAALLVVTLSVIKSLVVGIFFFPTLNDFQLFITDTVSRFPAELVLTFKDKKLSINKPVPYIVPLEKEMAENSTNKNFVVIDTSKSLDLKTFQSYDTAIFVTQDGYMAADDNGSVKIQTFRNIPDYAISKSIVTHYGTKIEGMINNFSWLIVLVFVFFTALVLSIKTYIGVLFFSLLGVLVTLIATRIQKHKLSFSHLFALSVYMYTIVLLFDGVNFLLGWPTWIGLPLFVGLALFIEKKA